MEDESNLTERPRRVFGMTPNEEAVKEFAKKVIDCETELMRIQSEVSAVRLTRIGYKTLNELDYIETDHDEVIQTIADLQQACIEESLDPVSGINSDLDADKEFQGFVRDQRAVEVVADLDRSAARIDNRIENKRAAATAKLSLTISVIAVGVSVLIFMSSGIGVI